mgnify:CR=1 FL=1
MLTSIIKPSVIGTAIIKEIADKIINIAKLIIPSIHILIIIPVDFTIDPLCCY